MPLGGSLQGRNPELERNVVLVGTSHGYQLQIPGWATERGALEFQQAILALCREQNIAGIAEEMSDYALAHRRAVETAGRYAATTLNLPHRMCDLDAQERQARHIDAPNEIEALAFGAGHPRESWGQLVRDRNFDPRETEWHDRVLAFNRWPCLFICGSHHVDSFAEKLRASGVIVDVWAVDWEPTDPTARVAD